MLTILHNDALTALRTLDDESVQCVVTSPPYWGLRDYGVEDQLGLEDTPDEYVRALVVVFDEVWRVLRNDGTVWLNLGDTYSAHKDCKSVGQTLAAGGSRENAHVIAKGKSVSRNSRVMKSVGLKNKDLVGIPWRVAFELQAYGWYLRSDIIWSKPNPMPESVTDRPTKAHEYIFLLAKSEKYYFDQDAVREPHKEASLLRQERAVSTFHKNVNGAPGQTPHTISRPRPNAKGLRTALEAMDHGEALHKNGRNIRTVWTVSTHGFPDAHFATFPPDLIKPCILAGAPVGGVVLDPFAGSGTTGKVAIELGRRAILIEPKAEYVEMIERRCRTTIGLPFGTEPSPELSLVD